jgi:hypothetical protein
MFDLWFIVCVFFFSVFCFFEVLVFNEEVLLALCFFCFIFFSFNSLGDTVVDIFQSRAAKFEADLLLSFNVVKNTTILLFDNYAVSCGFGSKFKVLSITIVNYLNILKDYSKVELSQFFHGRALVKLIELRTFESKLIAAFQNQSTSLLLYPLIFQTVKRNVSAFGSINHAEKSTSTFKPVISILKSVSLR